MQVHIYMEPMSRVSKILGAAAGGGRVDEHPRHPAALRLRPRCEPMSYITDQRAVTLFRECYVGIRPYGAFGISWAPSTAHKCVSNAA